MTSITTDTSTLTIPVDREHSALRLAVVGIFVVAWAIAFAIINQLIASEGLNLIAIILAFVAAGLSARVGENILQKRWPSGRAVQVDEQGVRVVKKGTLQNQIHANQPGTALLWRFQNKRRSRVPKGWYILACALEQDDNYLPVYTFASPEEAATMDKLAHFTELTSEKEAKARDTRHDSLRYAGEQRRLRLAETHRWTSGAEMSLDDFERYITRLNGQFEQWMP